jgi:hypothetical protein
MSRDDPQATRLYAWEDACVAPRDSSRVQFARMQALIDHVWQAEGLRWPPRLAPLPRQARTLQARASRTRIEAPESLPSWILLHEIAHAMLTDIDGAGPGHGPAFVGLYVHLLVAHARMDRAALERSLTEAGLAFARDARPRVGA